MKNIIRDCLGTAETLSLQSIGFPAIGTGNLGFPKPEFAKLIISEVLKFSSKNHLKTLQEVQFLLHPKDVENIQVQTRLLISLSPAGWDLCSSASSWSNRRFVLCGFIIGEY